MTQAAAQRLVRSALSSVKIADVAARREELLREHCTADERGELASRHVQSLAGSLALKQALAALLTSPHDPRAVRLDELEIRRRADGAPVVTRCPAGLGSDGAAGCPSLCVSISHTRDTAVGLAAVAEPVGAPREDATAAADAGGGRG